MHLIQNKKIKKLLLWWEDKLQVINIPAISQSLHPPVLPFIIPLPFQNPRPPPPPPHSLTSFQSILSPSLTFCTSIIYKDYIHFLYKHNLQSSVEYYSMGLTFLRSDAWGSQRAPSASCRWPHTPWERALSALQAAWKAQLHREVYSQTAHTRHTEQWHLWSTLIESFTPNISM